MKQLEVRIRIRNNLLIARRTELGFMTQTAAASAIGMSIGEYNGYECLRTKPTNKDGSWTGAAKKIAEFHGVSPAELWPEVLQQIKQTLLTSYIDAAVLMPGAVRRALPIPSMDVNELHNVIMQALNSLKHPRDKILLMLYYGITEGGVEAEALTYTDIANQLDISTSRVIQIIERGKDEIHEKYGHILGTWES